MQKIVARHGDVRAILDSIRHVVQVLRVSASAAERRAGLSAAQLYVLHQLRDRPVSSINALAARTHTHQSSVSVVVARLVGIGLVTRRRSRTDGRRVELALTPAGRARLARAPAAAQERLVAALERLSSRERARLADGLAGFVAALGVTRGAPRMFFEEEDG
jgi:DNA-binding MarR family transcriptional regulator